MRGDGYLGPDVRRTESCTPALLAGKDLVERRNHSRICGGGGLGDARHLAERQILVEALGGQAVNAAREQRHEGAAGGVRPTGAAIEVHRHAAARARMLEQSEVLLRRTEEHRHLVERHAAAGLVQDAAHDLDRFPPFARRRKHHDVARALPDRRTLALEHVPTQTGQIGSWKYEV